MSDFRPLSPSYAATPQIEPSQVAEIAAAGFTTVICNRPDSENPPALQASVLQEACEAAGLAFIFNPFSRGMTAELIEEQDEAIAAAQGPVLAYCASGMRSTILWAALNVKELGVDTVIETGLNQGYDLRSFQPMLENIAAS